MKRHLQLLSASDHQVAYVENVSSSTGPNISILQDVLLEYVVIVTFLHIFQNVSHLYCVFFLISLYFDERSAWLAFSLKNRVSNEPKRLFSIYNVDPYSYICAVVFSSYSL